jgi:hypothetical protein|nr:MAG TPA: hypothetical protein [Caudoviricetes sp.]
MTGQEIVQALRCCAKGLGHDDACENCKVGEIQNRREYIEFAAANAIERLTDENAALRKKVPLTEDTMINLAAQALGVEPSRLRELAEADKDGRVVVLPCKVGQRVFALMDTDKHISECEVKRIGMGNEIGFIGLEPIGARGREYGVALNGFGKTVFLTREAAEKALEGIKDGY